MSTGYSPDLQAGSADSQAVDAAREVLDTYYSEEIQAHALGEADGDILYVDLDHVERHMNAEDASTIADSPERYAAIFEKAVEQTDSGRGAVGGVTVRLVDSTDRFVEPLGVSEVNSEHVGDHIAVWGQLSAVTKVKSFPKTAVFQCRGCGFAADVPQDTREFREPEGVCECEGSPRWQLNYDKSQWVDHRKLKLQQPPEDAANGETQHITVHVFDDLTKDQFGTPLTERVGQEVTVYATAKLNQQDGRNESEYLFEHYLKGHAHVFDDSGIDSVDIDAHREEIETHATADDVYERFCGSIAPQIHATEQMDLAMKVCGAFLFAAPRVDPDDGAMYRGDIHAALIGDPGMAKSVLLNGVSEFSPDCEHRSATGLSSDVGLVAAAVDDDFGDGGWSLKPGILVRAGMHAVIDEIDKGPDDLEKINDAMEGRQIASIDKAGMKADLKTRTGVLCSGNPEGSRFNKHDPLPEQIDVDESLLTRFDAIVMLVDEVDEQQDAAIADHITSSFDEGIELMKDQSGDVEPDRTKREVPADVARAWVALGRKITPSLTESAQERLEEFYVDVRSVNDDPDTISATARQLEGGIRLAMSYARMRLSDTVEEQDVDMAIEVSRSLIGQTFDAEDGTFDIDKLTTTDVSKPQTQSEQRRAIRESLGTEQALTPAEIAEDVDMDESTVRDHLRSMSNKNPAPVMQPTEGVWRGV